MSERKTLLTITESEQNDQELASALDQIGKFRLVRFNGGRLPEFDAAVFDCQVLAGVELDRLRMLSGLLGQRRILILANQISVQAYREVGTLQGMTALQKPYQMGVLQALVEHMFKADENEPTARMFPRFITDEPVRALVLRTGLIIPTRMKNYSAGGAFLEYHGISLKVGDTIQVGIANEGVKKAMNAFLIRAKVVWIKEGDGPRSPARGVGIQFIDQVKTA